MKCSLVISNFVEEISSLFHSVVVLYFFALIIEEGFLISPCYSLELCIQMLISFLFSIAFHFFSQLFLGLLIQPFCFFAFIFHGDGLDPCLLYNVTNLLNQIPYDYTVELRNRFKGLDLIECLMNYGWRLVTLYRRQE